MPNRTVAQQGYRQRRREAGQAAVEYALVLTLLLTLTIGGVEGFRAIYIRNTVAYAAYEGARYGMTHPTDFNGIRAKAIQVSIAVELKPGDIAVDCGRCTRGSWINVAITYPFKSSFSLVIPNMTFTTSAKYYIK